MPKWVLRMATETSPEQIEIPFRSILQCSLCRMISEPVNDSDTSWSELPLPLDKAGFGVWGTWAMIVGRENPANEDVRDLHTSLSFAVPKHYLSTWLHNGKCVKKQILLHFIAPGLVQLPVKDSRAYFTCLGSKRCSQNLQVFFFVQKRLDGRIFGKKLK